MGRLTLSAAAPTRCPPSCPQPSGWRGPSPGNLASAPLGCTVSCQHAWAQQGAGCSPTPHCMSATPRKAGPGGLRGIPTQFWGSRDMAGRVKTLQNKKGYLVGGPSLSPTLLPPPLHQHQNLMVPLDGWKGRQGVQHLWEHGEPQLPWTHTLWEALPTGPAPVKRDKQRGRRRRRGGRA